MHGPWDRKIPLYIAYGLSPLPLYGILGLEKEFMKNRWIAKEWKADPLETCVSRCLDLILFLVCYLG